MFFSPIYLSRGTTPFTRFQTPTSQCLDNELALVLRVITYNFDTSVATMLRRYISLKTNIEVEILLRFRDDLLTSRMVIFQSLHLLDSLHILHPASSWNEVTPVGFSVLRNPPSKSSLMSGKQKTEGWPRFIEQASGLKNPTRQRILRSHTQKGRWDLAFVRKRNYTSASFSFFGLDVHYDRTKNGPSESTFCPNEITVR